MLYVQVDGRRWRKCTYISLSKVQKQNIKYKIYLLYIQL